MAERKPAKKDAKKTAKGFTDEERAAMKVSQRASTLPFQASLATRGR